MFQIERIEKEHQLNKLLKSYKKSEKKVGFLFYSQWDKWCIGLINQLDQKSPTRSDSKLYLVNSFDTPHSFVIFNPTKLPFLVLSDKKWMYSTDYLPEIYCLLGLDDRTDFTVTEEEA